MSRTPNIPTVVLVHGGFADASFWGPVITELQARGLPVLAPPNPLRGLARDAEYIAGFVNQIDGPVLLVGHSYGGAVISVAGAAAPRRRSGLRRGVRPRRGRVVRRDLRAVRATRRCSRGAAGELPARGRRDRRRTVDRARALPVGVRRRPAHRDHRGARGHAASVRRDLRRSGARRRRGRRCPRGRSWPPSDNAIHRMPSATWPNARAPETIEVDASHSIALSQPKAVAELIQTAVDAVTVRG